MYRIVLERFFNTLDKEKAPRPLRQRSFFLFRELYALSLFLMTRITAHKLIYTTGRINQLGLTCIERMGGT